MSSTAGKSTPDAVSEFYGYSNIPLGLSSALYTQNLSSTTSWDIFQGENEIDTSAYAGKNLRLVIQYTNGTCCTSYQGDFQIGATIDLGNTTYNLSTSRTGWQSTTTNTSTYSGASWSDLGTSRSGGRWSVTNAVPSSTGTGTSVDTTVESTGYHVYAETSGRSMSGYNFWLRSPITSFSTAQSLEFNFVSFGPNVGSYKVYFDVTS
tara:strand:- start:164 stop:784 length:621 start_codon:yes stop_codon:yes gene_type:complete